MPTEELRIPDGIKDLTGLVKYDGGYSNFYGGLADVSVGEFKGLKVAVKLFRFDKEEFKRRFVREAKTWTTLQQYRHDNILELLGIINWDVKAPGGRLAFVSPYQENGTVLGYIKNNARADRKALVLQIAEGLRHIHSREVVHGDLKSNNVLISKNGVAKIADFGQSRIIDDEAYITQAQHAHSTIYIAPEIISYLYNGFEDVSSLELNTKEADVYSFSITSAEVLKGEEHKISGRTPALRIYEDVVKRGLRPLRDGIPEAHYALLTRCWTADVGGRLKIDSIVGMLRSMVQ